MAEKTNNKPDENEEITVTLELEDGETVECAIVTIFDMNNQDYIVLLPVDEKGQSSEGEVWIYRYFEDPDDENAEPRLEYIDDDDEYEAAIDAFDELLDSEEFGDDPEEAGDMDE